MRFFTLFLLAVFSITAASAQVVITEIMYNPPESGQDMHEFIEIHNAGATAVDLSGYSFASGVEFTFPDGTSLAAGAYMITTVNSEAINNTFGIANAMQWTAGSLSNGGELIQLADANGTVVDEVDYDDGSGWSSLADGSGPSLILCDVNADNTLAENWSTSNNAIAGTDIFASPAAAEACASGPSVQFIDTEAELAEDGGSISFRIVISNADMATATPTVDFEVAAGSTAEVPADASISPASSTFTFEAGMDTVAVTVMVVDDAAPESLEQLTLALVNPSAGLNIVGANAQATLNIIDNDTEIADIVINEIMYNPPGADDMFEYLELYNNGSASVNLAGYYFEQGIEAQLPAIDLAAGEFLVLAVDSVAFQTTYGGTAYQWTSGGLGNGGETIELRDASGNTVDEVTYDDGGDWPTDPDGSGNALVLCDPTSDNNLAASWSAGTQTLDVFISGVEIFASPGAANDCTVVEPEDYMVYPIGTVTTINADGVADSLGTRSELTGIVHGVNLHPSGVLFTLIDADNNGIAVFNGGQNFGYTVAEGDEVTVQGPIGQYNGLIQVLADSLWMNSAGNALQAVEPVSELNEDTESQLVQIEGVMITDAVTAGGGLNVTVTDGTNEYLVRVDFDTNIDTTFINGLGTQALRITGIGGQFDSSSPYTEGYQLLPRYQSDIEVIVSTQEPTWAAAVELYPVPVQDVLTVKMPVAATQYNVYNSLGQLVLNQQTDAQQLNVTTAELAKGVYYLELISNKERLVRKFVKE